MKFFRTSNSLWFILFKQMQSILYHGLILSKKGVVFLDRPVYWFFESFSWRNQGELNPYFSLDERSENTGFLSIFFNLLRENFLATWFLCLLPKDIFLNSCKRLVFEVSFFYSVINSFTWTRGSLLCHSLIIFFVCLSVSWLGGWVVSAADSSKYFFPELFNSSSFLLFSVFNVVCTDTVLDLSENFFILNFFVYFFFFVSSHPFISDSTSSFNGVVFSYFRSYFCGVVIFDILEN